MSSKTDEQSFLDYHHNIKTYPEIPTANNIYKMYYLAGVSRGREVPLYSIEPNDPPPEDQL